MGLAAVFWGGLLLVRQDLFILIDFFYHCRLLHCLLSSSSTATRLVPFFRSIPPPPPLVACRTLPSLCWPPRSLRPPVVATPPSHTPPPHAYLGQGRGIILQHAIFSENRRITVIVTIDQSVTTVFPCPAYKVRCPITEQPPTKITITQTGSISTSNSISVPSLSAKLVFFCVLYRTPIIL